MKKIIVIGVSILIVILIVLKLFSNFKKINANKNVDTDLLYVTVKVEEAKSFVLSDSIVFTGNTAAVTEIVVSSETSGLLTYLNADEGDTKSENSIIATIDDKFKKLALQKAELTKNKLETDLERSKNLFNGGSITQQQLDEAQNFYNEAVILYEQSKIELEKTSIKSPLKGIIAEKYVEAGEYVNFGSPIAKIIDISKLKININVSETNVYKLKINQKVNVTTDIYPDIIFEGIITFISSQGDDAHNYIVEVTMQNNIENQLKAGTFAKIYLQFTQNDSSLYIPRNSVIGNFNDAKVYVAENEKAILKNIIVEEANDYYVKVISGVIEGEKIITDGKINLSDNKEIKILN
jgi:RND family efflux transporter MFP subunit